MAEDGQLKQRENAAQAQAQEQAQASAIKETEALCKHCGSALEPGLAFCTACGEKVGGEEFLCEFCRTKTSKDLCPHCGRRVRPLRCAACGADSIYDACENCGAVLNPALEKAFAQEAFAEPAQMASEEAATIEAEFNAMEASDTDEFKAFQKKLVERHILLEERGYFSKREKRIVKAFGSRPFTLELPDPEEEAFRMKAYAALEKTVLEREERAIEAELERLFPPVVIDTSEAEQLTKIEKNRAEMERKYSEALANVEGEIEAFRIEEERKRIEEERRRKEEEERREAERQRQMEIERRRLEEERRKRRFHGFYYHTSHNGMLTADLSIDENRAVCRYRCSVCGNATINYSVSIDGSRIVLTGGRKYGNYCSFREYSLVENYSGSANDSGTVLTGQWHKCGDSAPVVFYKR